MTPPITMIVAAALGVALGYSGRRWWLSGLLTGILLTIYGLSGGGDSKGVILTGAIVTVFFPLFFAIGGLTGLFGHFLSQRRAGKSVPEP
ncbi:MAG: hypothetical protein JSV18_05765 [Candidatus Bathyarchaeota archaeon]|nr:MAG: hypothetical protein JSV18_05765 [Candidatus Bathyarchaeota archaeon]